MVEIFSKIWCYYFDYPRLMPTPGQKIADKSSGSALFDFICHWVMQILCAMPWLKFTQVYQNMEPAINNPMATVFTAPHGNMATLAACWSLWYHQDWGRELITRWIPWNQKKSGQPEKSTRLLSSPLPTSGGHVPTPIQTASASKVIQ